MTQEDQVGKNFAWISFSQVITRLFGLVFFIYMSFILLEKGMGQYNFAASFTAFWFILADFGIGNYLYREWSKGDTSMEKIKRDFNVVLTLKLLMAVVIIVPFIITNFFINNDILLALILYYMFVVLSSVITQADLYFNAVNNFRLSAIRGLLEKAIIIVIGGIALLFYPNIISVFGAMIIAQLAALIYYFKRNFPFTPHLHIDWQRVRYLIKKGLPFAFFGIFISLYGKIDMVMLRYIDGFEAVGWYGAGYKAYEIANIFPGMLFLPAIFPILSRMYNSHDRSKYIEFLNRSIRILFVSSMLLSIVFVFLAPYLIGNFFPPSFAPSTLVMRIVILSLTVSSVGWLFANLLNIQNKEKTGLKIIIASSVVNVILNIFLIPRYSLYGAASATVIAEVFNLVLLQHYVDWERDGKMLLRIVGVVIIIMISLFMIRLFGYTNNLLVGAIYLCITVGLLWGMRLIQKGDVDMFYLPIKNKITIMFFNKSKI